MLSPRTIIPGALLVVLLSLSLLRAGDAKVDQRTIQGWTVFVEHGLARDQSALEPMLLRLDEQLAQIAEKLPEPLVEELRKTPFWLVKNDPYADQQDLLGLFFSSREWLEENRYDPDKYLAIQFNKRFGTETSQNIVFHELAHAYHARVIGLDNPRLVELYEKISSNTPRARDRCPREGGVYAFSNVDEFFATFSQAYFGGTCAYPNNRNLLRLKHPEMLDYLQDIWGF